MISPSVMFKIPNDSPTDAVGRVVVNRSGRRWCKAKTSYTNVMKFILLSLASFLSCSDVQREFASEQFTESANPTISMN